MFMGCEFGQTWEWNYADGLPWHLLAFAFHYKLQDMVRELNTLYRSEPAMHQVDDSYSGFEWIDFHDADSSIIAFVRFARDREDFLVFCCNFTPVPRHGYRIGVPKPGWYREVFNSDSEFFGGSNLGNGGGVLAEGVPSHGRPASVCLTLPPLAVVALKP
jgi:1,4-alpha-glucan branching enzyme